MATFIDAQCDLPLFRAPLARPTDPATSHAAARRAPVGRHERMILDALTSGPAGQTELAARTGLSVAAVSRRMKRLREQGLVERCGECRSASGGREGAYRMSTNGR